MSELVSRLREQELILPLCGDAADEIERLRAEVKQCALELGEAAKLLQQHYPRPAGIYEEACGRARVAIGLTPCEPRDEQSPRGEGQ